MTRYSQILMQEHAVEKILPNAKTPVAEDLQFKIKYSQDLINCSSTEKHIIRILLNNYNVLSLNKLHEALSTSNQTAIF